jgi:hypothetical protein
MEAGELINAFRQKVGTAQRPAAVQMETVEEREIRKREAIEERVAIMIHDGELSEAEAKIKALDCVLDEFDREGV